MAQAGAPVYAPPGAMSDRALQRSYAQTDPRLSVCSVPSVAKTSCRINAGTAAVAGGGSGSGRGGVVVLRRGGVQLKPKRGDDLHDCVETRYTFAGERLVQAFA